MNGLRTNPRWEATSGCSNVTAEKSKAYCERVHNAQARIERPKQLLGKARFEGRRGGDPGVGA